MLMKWSTLLYELPWLFYYNILNGIITEALMSYENTYLAVTYEI